MAMARLSHDYDRGRIWDEETGDMIAWEEKHWRDENRRLEGARRQNILQQQRALFDPRMIAIDYRIAVDSMGAAGDFSSLADKAIDEVSKKAIPVLSEKEKFNKNFYKLYVRHKLREKSRGLASVSTGDSGLSEDGRQPGVHGVQGDGKTVLNPAPPTSKVPFSSAYPI